MAPTSQSETNSYLRWANYENSVGDVQALGEEGLMELTGQQLRDIWHGFVGKKMGLKGSTGMGTKPILVAGILGAYYAPRYYACRVEDIKPEDEARFWQNRTG